MIAEKGVGMSKLKQTSLSFGKKEKVLNYTCQTYQLSRPAKVGAVMSLIRECQPRTLEEWETWYFANARTTGKNPSQVTEEVLNELGERLYTKVKEVVIPEWSEAFAQITAADCISYIKNLAVNRTYDGYVREIFTVEEVLAKRFPKVRFEQSPEELDHAGDIDYLCWVGKHAFGLQIKPSTTNANFGNYSTSERMKKSFESFTAKYVGRVFIVVSVDEEIANWDSLQSDIQAEVARLQSIQA